jgi:hypothetical protein
MSIMKRAALVAVVASAMTLAIAVSPAGAGPGVTATTEGQTATLTITKVVQGTPPAGTEFMISVECEASGPYQLTFGATGGQKDIIFTGPDQCTSTEPDNGGASSTTGLGRVDILQPTGYAQTVTNTFDPAEPTTTAKTAATTATRPTFTG